MPQGELEGGRNCLVLNAEQIWYINICMAGQYSPSQHRQRELTSFDVCCLLLICDFELQLGQFIPPSNSSWVCDVEHVSSELQ